MNCFNINLLNGMSLEKEFLCQKVTLIKESVYVHLIVFSSKLS
jgi:hypothetical protein